MKLTANKVTIARIVLLPLPSAFMLYGGVAAYWIAFAIFCLLGATDFVDGMMARKEGPTTLGSLLDPVADKMWVAAAVLALSSAGLFGIWFPTILLLREFLLTALRTSVSLKKHPIKTSLLGKMKTIFQMGGLGTIFLTWMLPPFWLVLVMAFLTLALLSVWLYYVQKRKPPVWIMPVLLAFFGVGLIRFFVSAEISILCQALVISSITWLSAISYLTESYKLFVRDGFYAADWIRLFWIITFGLGITSLAVLDPHIVLLIIIIVSFELALGGVDNIVAAENGLVSSTPFLITASAALLTIFCFYLHFSTGIALPLVPILIGLAIVCAGVFSWRMFESRSIFWRAL